MKAYSVLFFSLGLAMIAGAAFHHACPILGALGCLLTALWIVSVTISSATRTLMVLFFASIIFALIVTLRGGTPYLTVCGLTSIAIGWQLAAAGRQITAFPKKAQNRFLRSYVLPMLALGIGGSLLAMLGLYGHYYLSFPLALGLAVGALLLVGYMFRLGLRNKN